MVSESSDLAPGTRSGAGRSAVPALPFGDALPDVSCNSATVTLAWSPTPRSARWAGKYRSNDIVCVRVGASGAGPGQGRAARGQGGAPNGALMAVLGGARGRALVSRQARLGAAAPPRPAPYRHRKTALMAVVIFLGL